MPFISICRFTPYYEIVKCIRDSEVDASAAQREFESNLKSKSTQVSTVVFLMLCLIKSYKSMLFDRVSGIRHTKLPGRPARPRRGAARVPAEGVSFLEAQSGLSEKIKL